MSLLVSNAVDRLGPDIMGHFRQLIGRNPTAAELDTAATYGMSHSWADTDAFISQFGGAVPSAGGPVLDPGTNNGLVYGNYPMANLSMGDIGNWATKIGTAIGTMFGGGGTSPTPTFPAGGPMPFPPIPGSSGGMPNIPMPSGPGGMPQLPQLPSGGGGGGVDQAGMGGMIIRTIARIGRSPLVVGIVGGEVFEWVYHKVLGWHWRKRKHRRMNVLNPRALSRANRRVVGFSHIATRTLKQLGYHISKTRHVKQKAKAFGGRYHKKK